MMDVHHPSTGLDRPHHDGSDLYVSNPSPRLGDHVALFVRVPSQAGVSRVVARSTLNAEPVFVEAVVDRTVGTEAWWRADIVAGSPVTSYRFLLDGPSDGYRWLTAAGIVDTDVPDANDFRLVTHDPPPAWVADAVFYQVFPDRFASAIGAREWPSWAIRSAWDDPLIREPGMQRQLYGGDLPGIEAHLDHLEELGVNAVYLTPFFPGPSNHRYNASSFDVVDPLLGGDEALVRLVRAMHDRGIRLMGDLTLNHVGSTHPWFVEARQDPSSVEASFFFPKHDDYEYWFDVPTLPKLDHRSAELRRRLYEGPDSVAARWLRPPFDLDGWRIDVANMAGRLGAVDVNHEIATATRATMAGANPDAYLVAEHANDPSADLRGDGWHGTMSYAGFTRPMWRWLGDPVALGRADFLGSRHPLPESSGGAAAWTIDAFRAAIPWRSWTHNLTLLGSHDTARWLTVTAGGERALVGAGILLTFPGIPSILYGDEVGLEGLDGEDSRKTMPWDTDRWDREMLEGYGRLVRLRRDHPALRRGGFRWLFVGDDVLVYQRESVDERILVQAARAAHPPVSLPPRSLDPSGSAGHLLGGPDLEARRDVVELPADGPAFHAWSLS